MLLLLLILGTATAYGEADFAPTELTVASSSFPEKSLMAENGRIDYDVQPLVLTFGFGLTAFPGLDENSLVNVELGMGNRAPRFKGVQAAVLYNYTGDRSSGVQLTTVTNIAYGDFKGVQGSAVLNLTRDYMSGVQCSCSVNYAGAVGGLQLGVVNWAGRVDGVQVGIVNVAHELDGMALGLVNLSKNGIMDMGTWCEIGENPRFYSYFQSGNDTLYTLLFIGNEIEDFWEGGENLMSGIHLGHRTRLGPFSCDVDAGIRSPYSTEELALVPSFRSVVSYDFDRVGIYCGMVSFVSYPGCDDLDLFEGSHFN
ncbi:MAG: hypothetical protein PQJ60_13160, partial [Spirochaetales bacterium]|nr:hypothetical protein [Spirochaetales bacterium]